MVRMKGVTDSEASSLKKAVFRGARKRLGQVPDPLRIMAHSSGVMFASSFFELSFGRARALDVGLKSLAQLKVASMIGCVF
jgi:hypothetical protein